MVSSPLIKMGGVFYRNSGGTPSYGAYGGESELGITNFLPKWQM